VTAACVHSRHEVDPGGDPDLVLNNSLERFLVSHPVYACRCAGLGSANAEPDHGHRSGIAASGHCRLRDSLERGSAGVDHTLPGAGGRWNRPSHKMVVDDCVWHPRVITALQLRRSALTRRSDGLSHFSMPSSHTGLNQPGRPGWTTPSTSAACASPIAPSIADLASGRSR
jgi:hypothetical protein